jgi:hypothetical protein
MTKKQLMAIIVRAPLMGLIAGYAATAAMTKTDDIPAPLRVPTNLQATLRAQAAGVQIYQCRAAKADAARVEWQLKGPEADLSENGKTIGKHYAGPTWEAVDGSKVIGEVVAQAKSPDPNAVAWLLLSAKSTSGNGVFSHVRFIQRLHTVGGIAPAVGCDQASVGTEVRVSYTAEYWFYADKT